MPDRLLALALTPWYIATVVTTHTIVAVYDIIQTFKEVRP